MLQTLFYVSHNGEEVGPLSIEDIRNQMTEGKLLESDFIYVEEKEDWVPLQAFFAEERDNKTPVAQPVQERRQSPAPESFSLLPQELHISAPEIKHEEPHEAANLSSSHLPSPPENMDYSIQEELHQSDGVTANTQVLPQEFVLKKGTAEIILEDLRPGRIELMVSLEGDRATQREELKIIGGDPHEIKIHLATSFSAGDKKILCMEVVDEYGEPCMDFKGSLSFQLDEESPLQVTLHGPKTEHPLECCRAGNHVIKIKSVTPNLKHTDQIQFEVVPGEPTTLKVHTEGPLRAGGQQTVKIQAFDAFGNLATSYDGPLKVEVVEHPNTTRGSSEPALRIMPSPKKGA